jgi:RNA binding exosome subunit
LKAVRAVVRGFVYGTEDEARVVDALIALVAREGDADARGKLARSRLKAHHGSEIVLYEGVLKAPKELRRFFDRLRAAPSLVETLRSEFEARLDEDRVLHFRVDKQAAVEGSLQLGAGGDSFNVAVKFEDRPGQPRQGFPFE